MSKINPNEPSSTLPSFYLPEINLDKPTDGEISYFEQAIVTPVIQGSYSIDSIINFALNVTANTEKQREFIYYAANKFAYLVNEDLLENLIIKAESKNIIREFDDVKLMYNIVFGFYERGFEYDDTFETDEIPTLARDCFIKFFNHYYAYQVDIVTTALSMFEYNDFISALIDNLHPSHKVAFYSSV